MAEKRERLTPADWTAVGEFIQLELDRRKSDRTDREAKWDEIDRQVAMEPAPKEVRSGDKADGRAY